MKEIAEGIVWPGLHLDKNEIDRILNRHMSTIEERLRELRARVEGLFFTLIREIMPDVLMDSLSC